VEYVRETGGIRVDNKNRIIKVLPFHENVYPSPPIRCSARNFIVASAREFLIDPSDEARRTYWAHLEII
jgi:hypothetical protein